MAIKWLLFFSCMQLSCSMLSCPQECACSLDVKGRFQTLCSNGGMKTIPVQLIDPNVEVLSIRGPRNNIAIGPIFGQFKKLEILRIVESNIPSVGTHSFWGIKNLKVLDLSRNNITALSDANFRGQDNLHELDLSFNRIHGMASWVFHHLKDLRRLNLAENSIVELVPRVFYMLGKLKHLDLSGNPLIDLPPDVFKDILELKELKCRHCNIKKVNPQVYNLIQHLGELDLGDNQLKYMEKDEFKDVPRLTKIKLDGNQLSVVIEHLFEAQKGLEYLDLSRNRLAKVTNGAFVNLSNLTYLDLSYNKLVKLEQASVVPLRRLRALNISGNIQMDMYDIEDTFQMLANLKSLFLADMGPLPLTLLTSFGQLRSLNLSGNHLVNISLAILDPANNLELLDLSRNQLNGFDDAFAIKLQKIKDVKLENNPLICDRCHMGSLIDIARSLRWKVFPVCFLPESLRGAKITDLKPTELDLCVGLLQDERHDAASTAHNFLMGGRINLMAFLCGIVFILVSVVITSSAVCYWKRRARYQAQLDKRSVDNSADKCIDLPSITGNEISFKFPMEEHICTIDGFVLPPPPPPPSKKAPVHD